MKKESGVKDSQKPEIKSEAKKRAAHTMMLKDAHLHKIECSECGGIFMSPNPNETLCRGCEEALKNQK